MSWTLHVAGPATLPQTCSRCKGVIIKAGAPSDPLPAGQPVYVNDRDPGPDGGFEADGTVAIDLPWGEKAPQCKAG